MCNTGKHIGPIRKKEHSRQQKHAFMPFMTGLLFLFVIVKFRFTNLPFPRNEDSIFPLTDREIHHNVDSGQILPRKEHQVMQRLFPDNQSTLSL